MKCRECGEDFEPQPEQDIPICDACWNAKFDIADPEEGAR